MTSHQAPNRKTIAIVLSVVFVLITTLTGVLASLQNTAYPVDKPVTESSSQADSEEMSDQSSAEQGDDVQGLSSENSSDAEQASQEKVEEPEEPVYYNVPDEMRAVMLVAGRDYLTAQDGASRATIAGQIDQALNAAKELTMNTIILDTKYQDNVLFSSPTLSEAQVDLDCTDYIATKARDMGFYVYATYDVTDGADGQGYMRLSDADGDTLDFVSESVGSFAEKYKFDGILLNNYYNPANGDSYAQYLKNGGGIGYQNYLRQVPSALVSAAAGSIRNHAPGTQVGLLTQAVWQNASDDPEGTETSAEFTALRDGNADTRALAESGQFDFVMVEDYGSTNEQTARFGIVADWWSKVTKQASVPLYIMHASDRVGIQSTGWTVYEQLTKQVIDLEKVDNIYGNAFNSLKALLDNPGNSTTTLIQYMNNQIDEQYVLSQLALTKPAQLTFTTKEPSVTFQGASDPREPVTLNGEKIPTNDSGYFTIREDLKAGVNTFQISHKNKTFTYTITRQVEVLKEIWPTGSINVDGGMQVSISALAYEDATVTASIGGQNITLALAETGDSESDPSRESGYRRYTGVFTAPSASASATSLGTISVTATAEGVSKTLTGASVTVNKIAKMGDGAVVQVVADQAETFPIATLNDNSNSSYFPLPLGTVDQTYGSEIVYKDGKKSYSYWKLQSGVRVYTSDIKATSNSLPDQNVISDMTVKSGSQYTTVTLATKEKVPYKTTYDGSKLVFAFEYTATVPNSVSLKNNALFASANWSGSSLTLALRKTGGFLGYKAYYEDGNLIFRFNNSPGSLSGARIVVDPGHGGSDPGAVGFYPGKDEADINLAVASKLVSDLKSKGASVLMVTPGSTMASRLSAARAFNPQVLVSVHCNTSTNASAKGTEVYYFYSFQKQLAANIASTVSSALNSTNRGAKAGLYYMTRESQFACVLAEIGFMSNEAEYTRLISSKYQTRVAESISNAIKSYLGGIDSGGGTGGTDDTDSSSSSSDSVELNEDELNLEVGDTAALKVSSGGDVTWKSEDTSIATVNSSGKVVAKSEGTTYIIATAEDGDSTAECEVNVGTPGGDDVTGVSLNKSKLTLSAGETYTMEATVKPSSANNQKVTWKSEDEDIATISSSGKITAEEEGETWITVTTKDGGYSADCEVVVTKADRSGGLVQSITISGDSQVDVGRRIELTASVRPSNAADPGVKWKSSDSDIAKISNDDDDSCKVEGVKNGTVTITATAYDDGKVSKSFTLKVGSGRGSRSNSSSSSDVEPKKGVMPTGVTISGSSTLKRGTRSEYTGAVLPYNCEDPGVKWEVSDDDILSFYTTDDENVVKVEGLKTGTAYLIGRSYLDKDVYKRFKITVKS